MNKTKFPKGWDEKRIHKALAHYENQSNEKATLEDERAFEQERVLVQIPAELLPLIREILAEYNAT